jgi:hypothetical protein
MGVLQSGLRRTALLVVISPSFSLWWHFVCGYGEEVLGLGLVMEFVATSMSELSSLGCRSELGFHD